MEVIQEWIKNIFIFIIGLSFVEILMPSGKIRPYIKYVFSLAIMAAILMPLMALLE